MSARKAGRMSGRIDHLGMDVAIRTRLRCLTQYQALVLRPL